MKYGRILLGGIAAAAGLVVLSGFYVVRPQERAVVRRLGRALEEPRSPGLHWRLPYPIEKVDRIKATEMRWLSIGFSSADRATGRTPDPASLYYLLGDRNIVSVEAVVQYTVPDPARYLFTANEPEPVLASAASAVLSRVLAGLAVDYVLTGGKAEIQLKSREALQSLVDSYALGVTIQTVSLQTVAPPQEVADKFRDVVAAREERDRRIQEAGRHQNRVLPEARGRAYRSLREAEGQRQGRTNDAKGRAERFTKVLTASRADLDASRRRLYLETMDEVLPRLKKIVIDSSGGTTGVTLGIAEKKPSPSAGKPQPAPSR